VTELPSGTVTFLFTDIEGSTRLWEEHPDAMQGALARHDALVRAAIAAHGGFVVKTTGDGFHAAFAVAADAVDVAVAAQLALAAEPWGETGPLRVRMGVHTGAAEVRDGDYYGTALNRAARLMSVGHGGQVLASLATNELMRGSGVEFLDLGSHHLRDLGEPERIFQVLHPGLNTEFAPLRSLNSYATNLPLQMTSFVGRGRELVEITKAFDDNRVVTLTGVGGVGKTRLAVQVGAELLTRFGDGVWLCELGPLADRGLVPEVVAAALGVQQRPGMSPAESILAACKNRKLVLVLDNCEHLLDAAARLVETMVRACPGVCVLATSREGLGVSGERILVVRSLGLPATYGLPGDRAETADAVRLFCDRAISARDEFVLGVDNIDAVAQICGRLDGIPLAIELAAARVRMMTPGEIAERLDERFRLLTGGARTAVERHQTLRQAVDWSYDLLEPREQELLNRLGVFAGGFTLDAAESVAAGGGIETFDVLDGLGQLVDKSLVVADTTPSGTRYRLLETIRQYALERLEDADETDTTRRRHATWFAGFVAEASAGTQGPDEATWQKHFDREFDNVRAALTWATGTDDADLSLSLIGTFEFYSMYTRRLGYMLGPWTAAALATTGAADDPRFARVLAVRAMDHMQHERTDEAEGAARRAVDLTAAPGVPFSTHPWTALSLALIRVGRAAEVEGPDAFIEAARSTGDDRVLASALVSVATQWYVLGNLERLEPIAEEATLLARRIGNPTLLSLSAMYLGAALEIADPPRARSSFEMAIEHGTAVGAGTHVATPLAWLARMGTDASSPQWAARFRGNLDPVYEAGDTAYMVNALDLYSQALANTDRVESAAVIHAAVLQLSPHMSNPISVAHRRDTEQRLAAQLGEERFAELGARGAALGYEGTVALAFDELDRIIADNEH
jgi:predicted ATPase/class 3 adenylate cyclase